MNNEQRPYAIYTRKSVEDEVQKELTSLESQTMFCKNYAQIHQLPLSKNVYEDYGKSGGNMDRPAFQRLLKDIQSGEIGGVLVYKLDRLTRSLSDFAGVIDNHFKKHDVKFISVTEQFDTSTPQGVLFLNMMLMMAQFERQQTSLRVKDKIRNSRRQGIWTGGNIPFGYMSVDRKLVINPEESTWVRWIYEEYLKTGAVRSIAHRLRAEFPERQEAFYYEKIRTILQNPLYKGMIRSGQELVKGRHEALIDEDLWNKVQDRVPQRSTSKTPSLALLQGLCVCRDCGSSLIPLYVQKGGVRYRYYVCRNRHQGLPCSNTLKYINADALDNLILREVKAVLLQANRLAGLTEHILKLPQASQVLEVLKNTGETLDRLDQSTRRQVVRSFLKKVVVSDHDMILTFTTCHLHRLLGELWDSSAELEETRTLNTKLLVHGDKTQEFIVDGDSLTDPHVVEVFEKAHEWKEALDKGEVESYEELSKMTGFCTQTIRRYLRLTKLVPEVKQAIRDKTLNAKFRVQDFTLKKIPKERKAQMRHFNLL